MPLLRKGIVMPVEGEDHSKPAAFISDRAGYTQNLWAFKNELIKRPGKSLYGSAAISGGQVMGFGVLELAALKYLVRASKTSLQVYNTSTGAWDSIAVTPFNGTNEDFFQFATVSESGFLIITNGYDRIRKYTGSGNNSVLGGNPPYSKYCAYLSPYLLLAHITAGSTVYPWKVQWCDTDAPETWTGGNSGSVLLSSEPSPIQNIVKLNEYAAVYKEQSLWLLNKVETSDIFMPHCMKTGIGLASPRAIADVEGKHFFMGHNDFHVWNGISEEPFGKAVRDRVFQTIDRGKLKRNFAIHIKYLNEIWFFLTTSGDNWPTQVWKYNYRTGFWYFDTCTELTAAITWQKTSTQAWNDSAGTWDAAIGVWNSGETVEDWEEVIYGDVNGNSSKLDYSLTNDLGVAVQSIYESKDYTGDVLEFHKRWLQLDVMARGSVGSRLYVDYSSDEGSTWTNIPYTSSQAYITLETANAIYRLYFDVIADHVRFRFRNAESNELFILKGFYPYYLPREEVNG